MAESSILIAGKVPTVLKAQVDEYCKANGISLAQAIRTGLQLVLDSTTERPAVSESAPVAEQIAIPAPLPMPQVSLEPPRPDVAQRPGARKKGVPLDAVWASMWPREFR